MMTNLQSSAFVARTTQLLSSVARLRLLLVMFLTLTASTAWAETVTYTVSSTSEVTKSGIAPDGSSATYASTYSTKCQLTAGNSMTLTLSGYDGCKITDLTLSMKSNSSKGAGNMSMKIGNTTISSIATSNFNSSNWNGSWSTSYVDVTPSVTATTVGNGQSIVITIAATVNSLYCESFTITYETATPAPAYTVTFDAGSGSCVADKTEESGGAGVRLPEPTLNNCDDWTFAGWATSAVATETATAPKTLLGADEMYYPSDHCTLYAVYKRTEEGEGGGSTEEKVTFSDQGYTNQQEVSSYDGTNFSVAFDKGTNSNPPKYYTSGTAIRIYGGGYFTVSSNATITKIVLGFGSSDGSNAITTNVDTYSNGTWTGSANSVKFTIGGSSGNRRLSSLTVTTSGGNSSTTYYHSNPDCATQTAPSLSVSGVSESSLAFGDVTVNSPQPLTFTLSGSNLTADAILALSGTNEGLFSVSPTSVTPTNGSITKIITVTYTPNAKASHSATLTISSEGAESIEISLSGTGVAQMANYTVKHYQQNITDDNYTLKETETLSGEVGTDVTPAVKSYTGFTAPSTETVTIKADGTTVVEYYYTRNSYTLTWDVNEGNDLTGEYTSGSVKFGATITKPADPTRAGYNFSGWHNGTSIVTPASTMPANDLTYTAQWKATYTVTFLNHGEEVEQVTVEAGNPVTLPTEELTSCDAENYPDFFGWTETPIAGVGTEKPTDLITADFTPERSMTLHAVFVDQLPQAGGWQVVTSVSELVAGKIYTIGSYGSPTTGTAMGTQNTNNRGTTSWTTGTPVELTLGGSTGEWTLYDPVEEGYLCAASSSSNHLKTQSPLTDNGKWDITFSSKKAKIVAQGNYTRNIIRYNSTSSIFSCYSSGQNDIQLLTKSMATEPSAYITSCCETPVPTNGNAEVLSGTSVKLTWEGSASRYHITGGNLTAAGVYTNATSDTISGLTECETYTFNISAAPQDACESAAISVTATPFEAKTITFEDGSTTTTLSTTCENDEIVVPTPTARNCSTYVWIDEQGNEYDAGDKITPTTNMTLTTVWTVIRYTVTFVDYDGTTVLKESEVNCGEMPTPPADPTRPESNTHKYTFAGWTPSIKEADGKQTYTATYTETQHQITVIWMVNGEEYTEGEPSNMVLAGEKVAKLPTPPSPDDYCGQVFAGWTDQPINSAPIENAPAVLFNTPEASPTLYKEEDKTTVTFYAVFADLEK